MGLSTLFAFGVVLGWLVTGCVRRLTLRAGVVDLPNRRSSHASATATLGGVGIAAGAWGALVLGATCLGLPLPEAWGALALSSGVLLILASDEVRPMGRLAKLTAQLLAGLVLVSSGVVLRRLSLPLVGTVELGWYAQGLSLLWLVSVQNFWNFMDGIDGIVGSQSIAASLAMAAVATLAAPELAPLCLALAGSSLGFLRWNLPPARIFMGDFGAHFLGLGLGAAALVGAGSGVPFWIWLLPMGPFLFDTVYTVLRRLLRGENITLAHRFHLYQRLTALGWSHGRVDLAYLGCCLVAGTGCTLWTLGYRPHGLTVAAAGGLLLVAGAVWVERRWARGDVHSTGTA